MPEESWVNAKEPKPQPQMTEAAEKARADREAKQAAALRENLKRRKAQQRAREDERGDG
jgi:hypothetical protein